MIDFTIHNAIAGWIWLLGGSAVASFWVVPDMERFRREFGFFGSFRIMFGPDTPEASRLGAIQRKIFAFFGVWLALFLVLDWLW